MTSIGAILLVASFFFGQALAATTSEAGSSTLTGAARATVTRYVKGEDDDGNHDGNRFFLCWFGVMGTVLLFGMVYGCCKRRRTTQTHGRVEAQSQAIPSTSEEVPPYDKTQTEGLSLVTAAPKLGEAPPYSPPDDQSVSVSTHTVQPSSVDMEKQGYQELAESPHDVTNAQPISYSVPAGDAALIDREKQDRNENK